MVVMKRVVAISLTLLSPGMVMLALTLCCLYAMPECPMQAACHEENMLKSGSCCPSVETGPAQVSLHSSLFVLSTPQEAQIISLAPAVQVISTVNISALPLSSSPPVLNLRV